MELRHMRHFVAVAEELNFHRAAKRLNMAQPPLSQSIRRLEEALGVQLLERSRRGVALTRAGLAFLHEARTALKHADLARILALREAQEVPEIRVSFASAAMYRFLPKLLAELRKSELEIHVHLRERPSPMQVGPILTGDCDFAIVTEKTKGTEDCASLLLERAPLVAAIPADWPLARKSAVSLAELAEHPFILPPQHDYAMDSNATIALFKQAGVMPYGTQGDTHVSSTFTLVGAGLGCTMTTATAALMQPQNVSFVAISDGTAAMRWGLKMIWRPENLTDVARRFVGFAQDHVRNTPSLLDGENLTF